MTVDEVMAELKELGTEQTRKTFARHGAHGDFFGVRIADLKTIAKKIKGDQKLALELYKTGNGDAQYLAGIVVDARKMSSKEIQSWLKTAHWRMVSEYTVPWVAAESAHSRELALEWIESKKEYVAAAGWNTYAGLVALKPDSELDINEIEKLLARIVKEIPKAPNRVKYCMNSFVIAVGAYVMPLLAKAKAAAKKIGVVEVDMGDTSCQVPSALPYIEKLESSKRIGRKRKTVKC